jgi:hypothetical protein
MRVTLLFLHGVVVRGSIICGLRTEVYSDGLLVNVEWSKLDENREAYIVIDMLSKPSRTAVTESARTEQ